MMGGTAGEGKMSCVGCRQGAFDTPLAMAFQPIVDASDRSVFAYEALVRGPAGESAHSVLSQLNATNRYGFDQACRLAAIETAAAVGLVATGASLSINFLPNAVYEPRACIRATLETAERVGFPVDRLIFEITEGEEVADHAHLANIVKTYRQMGFRTAIDDFGAGYSNLNLLARFQPDIIKLDMELIRRIDTDRIRRLLVNSMVTICNDIGCLVVAEGIETVGEFDVLIDMGVRLIQGYLIAKPAFKALAEPVWPAQREQSQAIALCA
jgi:EAL domain-containing protein (putative c-di-GMP-specific phosphodiesterase class I)